MSVVQIDPHILGGAPVFRGKRVSVRALIDDLEGGVSIDTFLDDFPSVRREDVIALLDAMVERVVAAAARSGSSTSAGRAAWARSSPGTRSAPSRRRAGPA